MAALMAAMEVPRLPWLVLLNRAAPLAGLMAAWQFQAAL